MTCSFQDVQNVSPIDTSLRILPTSIFGCILNLVTGRLIHLLPPVYPAIIATVLSSASPLIMVFVNPAWAYWAAEFWSVVSWPMTKPFLQLHGLTLLLAFLFTLWRRDLYHRLIDSRRRFS